MGCGPSSIQINESQVGVQTGKARIINLCISYSESAQYFYTCAADNQRSAFSNLIQIPGESPDFPDPEMILHRTPHVSSPRPNVPFKPCYPPYLSQVPWRDAHPRTSDSQCSPLHSPSFSVHTSVSYLQIPVAYVCPKVEMRSFFPDPL